MQAATAVLPSDPLAAAAAAAALGPAMAEAADPTGGTLGLQGRAWKVQSIFGCTEQQQGGLLVLQIDFAAAAPPAAPGQSALSAVVTGAQLTAPASSSSTSSSPPLTYTDGSALVAFPGALAAAIQAVARRRL